MTDWQKKVEKGVSNMYKKKRIIVIGFGVGQASRGGRSLPEGSKWGTKIDAALELERNIHILAIVSPWAVALLLGA